MTIGAYSELLTRVSALLHGEGANFGAQPNDSETLDIVVNMAENRIYRDVRSRYNQKDFTALTTTSNAVNIPADLIAVARIWINAKPLEATTEEFIREYNANGSTGDCTYYAQSGNTIIFAPALANGTAIIGRYYARLPALKTTFSNAMFAAYEDLFVYACLLEGENFWPIINAPKWAAFYENIKQSIVYDEKNAIYNGSTIKRKPSVGLYR